MASVTGNLSLAKCDINDKITPTWINQNFDTIDQEIGDLKKAYVVSYGSSDGWTWRIWSNGIAESWKTLDQMFTLSQWGNVGVAHFEVPLPSIYKEKPNVQVSCEGYGCLAHGGLWSSDTSQNVSTITPYVASPTNMSGQFKIRVSFRVIGERS